MNEWKYPATRPVNATETLFGEKVEDPYRWLEDASDPEVRAWMDAQDRFAREALAALPGRERLAARLGELYYLDAVSPPWHRGDRYFYTRRHADREKAVVYWREGEDGEERILLDPNTMSPDGTTSLGVWVPTLDGKTVAYALRENNADEATLYVMDVATGAVSEVDVIPGAKYASPQWTPEGDGFYYTYLPSDPSIPVAERPGQAEVRFHRLGTDPAADPLVHERTGNPETFLRVSLSRDGRWLFVYIQHGWNRTDVYYRDLRTDSPEWRPFVAGRPAQFWVTAWRDRFYILTDEDAPRWRVLRAGPRALERERWEEIVPEAEGATLEDCGIIGDHLVLTYLERAVSRLEIRGLDGGDPRPVPLPEVGTAGGVTGNPDEPDLYFSFSSFLRPPEVYRLDVREPEPALWARVEVPVDASPYETEVVHYPSRDGTRVSMFILRRKNLPRDGSTPLLLYGYGGFNVSLGPSFNPGLFPWLEAGGAYAVPNLRGGGEYGEEWHRAGMLHRKQNVFDDFIAAAEYLVRYGYTAPERLAIQGGSNGGLLVGAAITQRPELFRAAVCAVPLLDMVRYHLFGSGRTWIPEYGSAEDKAEFRTLLAYSPYHHVHGGVSYPAVLLLSADNDDRVDPMHARKMAAMLQARGAGMHPVLLRIEQHAGHGGADQVRQRVEQSADTYAFLMHELGIVSA